VKNWETIVLAHLAICGLLIRRRNVRGRRRLRGVIKRRGDRSAVMSFSACRRPSKPAGRRAAARRSTWREEAPRVELAFHEELGPDAAARRLLVIMGRHLAWRTMDASIGAIGDSRHDAGGDARCFLYCWDPKEQRLRQVDGYEARSCHSARASQRGRRSTPGLTRERRENLFQLHAQRRRKGGRSKNTGSMMRCPAGSFIVTIRQTDARKSLPACRPVVATATSLLDRARNVWWCNLDAGEGDCCCGPESGHAQGCFPGSGGSVGLNRAFALLGDGRLLFKRRTQLPGARFGGGTSARTCAPLPEGSPRHAVAPRGSRGTDTCSACFNDAPALRLHSRHR